MSAICYSGVIWGFMVLVVLEAVPLHLSLNIPMLIIACRPEQAKVSHFAPYDFWKIFDVSEECRLLGCYFVWLL
jgi:hypothetical protein